MSIAKIGKMSLKNAAGLVARLAFSYFDEDGEKKISNHTGDITLGFAKTADPGDLGVPDGALIWMYVVVVGGQDNGASQGFVYERGNPATAHYVISGTIFDSTLALMESDGWENWAGSLTALPDAFLHPTSVAELKGIVAGNPGRTLRAVGTGHSWSPLVVTPDILVDPTGILDQGRKAWRWERDGKSLVTYVPSARWADVRDALTDRASPVPRMYLPTAGVLPSINATGFVAAGCHGTGWHQPTVSDLAVAMEIVAADGQVHRFSNEETPDAMSAVRANLGTLGIISQVTLAVEPMYRLWDRERILPTAEVMGPNPADSGGVIDAGKLSDLVVGNDYVELFWFPWSGGSLSVTDGAIWVKQYNRTQDDPRNVPARPPDWQAWFAEKVMEQVAEHPTSIVVPPVGLLVWQQLSSSIRDIERTDGFVDEAPRVLHYQEEAFPVIDLEIAIPIPATGPNAWDFANIVRAWYQVVNYVRERSERSEYPLTCCLHARFTGNSQALLSPAYEPAGSATHYCWIEVLSAYPKALANPQERQQDIAAYEALIATIAPTWIGEMKGRPHWAKYWQSIPGIDIKALYPQANLDRFNGLRRQLDPQGMFLNPFLKSLGLFD